MRAKIDIYVVCDVKDEDLVAAQERVAPCARQPIRDKCPEESDARRRHCAANHCLVDGVHNEHRPFVPHRERSLMWDEESGLTRSRLQLECAHNAPLKRAWHVAKGDWGHREQSRHPRRQHNVMKHVRNID